MKERNIGLDILRVLAMYLIVLRHAIVWGCPYQMETSSVAVNNWLFPLVTALSTFSVNTFILTSGYFLSRSTTLKFNKAIKIWAQMLVYSMGIWAIFKLGGAQVDKSLFEVATPFYHDQYWFVTQYLVMLILSPFAARLCDALDKKHYLILLGVLYFLLGTFVRPFPLGEVLFPGARIKQFILAFMLAGYLARFDVPTWVQKQCGKLAIVCLLLQWAGGLILNFLNDDGIIYGAFGGISIFTSLFVFLWFRKQTPGRIIGKLAALTPFVFGVYLIHENPLLRPWIWERVSLYSSWDSLCFWPKTLIASSVVFLVCCMVDAVRYMLLAGVRAVINKVRS